MSSKTKAKTKNIKRIAAGIVAVVLIMGMIVSMLMSAVIPVRADTISSCYTITAGDSLLEPKWSANGPLTLADSIVDTDYDKTDLTLGERTIQVTTRNESLGIDTPGNITINIVEPHKVTWKDEDGTVLTETVVGDGYPTNEIKTKPKQKGKVFVGWDWDFKKAVYGDIEIVAIYEPKVCKITWKSFDEVIEEDEVALGEKPQAPEMEDTAEWLFVGWDRDVEKATRDFTYEAVWESAGNELEKNTSVTVGFRLDGKAIEGQKVELLDENSEVVLEGQTATDGTVSLIIDLAGEYTVKIYCGEDEIGSIPVKVEKNGSIIVGEVENSSSFDIKATSKSGIVSIGITSGEKPVGPLQTADGEVKTIVYVAGAIIGVVILLLILAVLINTRRNSSNVKVKMQKHK